jgi:hypothetical protein
MNTLLINPVWNRKQGDHYAQWNQMLCLNRITPALRVTQLFQTQSYQCAPIPPGRTAEFEDLKSQIVISSWGGIRRARPYAFTEQGVAMLSSVLRSKRAVQVNIAIMRTFVRLREMLAAHKDLERKLIALEKKYDEQFRVVFDAIRALMPPPGKPRKKIYPVEFKLAPRLTEGCRNQMIMQEAISG